MYLDFSGKENTRTTSQTIGVVSGAFIGLLVVGLGIYFINLSGKKSDVLSSLNSDQEIQWSEGLEQKPEAATGPKSENTQVGAGNLVIEILKNSSGSEEAKTGDQLTVNYIGWLADGIKFDSSLDRGEPFIFQLGAGQVIKGWDHGLRGMKIGEKRKLIIPPNLAYGNQGAEGGAIPPQATLIFEIELLEIN